MPLMRPAWYYSQDVYCTNRDFVAITSRPTFCNRDVMLWLFMLSGQYCDHTKICMCSDVHCLVCAATLVLDSSVGMRQACPGEMVTYTCTVNQGFQLDWIVEPFLPTTARIQFTSIAPIGSSLNCSIVAAVRCEDFEFVATLTNTANPTVVMGTTLADMTSTLTFTATARLNGTAVQCRGATVVGFPMVNISLNIAGVFVLPWAPSKKSHLAVAMLQEFTKFI